MVLCHMGWVCIPKTHETTVWTLTAMGITATQRIAMILPRRLPLTFRTGPSQGEGLVEPTSPRESISEEGDIRNHENIEEDVADCEIDRDTRKVPEKGRRKIGMQCDPVEEVGSAQIERGCWSGLRPRRKQ